MVTKRGHLRFRGELAWAWRRDTRRAATLSRGCVQRPWGRGVPRLECRDGTHRLVPQRLALRSRADALSTRPERDQHRHARPRERLGAILRPGGFPGIGGFRRGAERITHPAAPVV